MSLTRTACSNSLSVLRSGKILAYRGCKLILDGGVVSISSDDISFPSEFHYGENGPFLKVFVFSYVKLLCDSPFEPTSPKPLRLKMKFLKALLTEDLRSLIKRFSDLADRILTLSYSTGSEDSTVLIDDELIHTFVEGIKDTPVFKEYLAWYRGRDPGLLRYVLTFLRFGKKLKYIDSSLDTVAFRDWCQVEDRLRTLKLSDCDVRNLKTVLSECLGPLQIDTLLPHFGGGKVAERHVLNVYDKLGSLGIHPRLEYAFCKPMLMSRSEEKGFHQRWWSTHNDTHDVSLLKFVPKDISKSRSICMEPNAFMFFQQEVWRWMRRSIDQAPIGRFINLSDQGVSRDAAIHGSQYLCTDTIDLSSASDSVSVELVKRVFPRDWLYYMLATRTSKVKTPDGSVRSVYKFAPMGSAVCFPTQCILFTGICIYAYHAVMTGTTTGNYELTASDVSATLAGMYERRSAWTPFRKKFEPPVVFGDDIACDSRVTGVVIDLLERFGFVVNVGKSFTGSRSFRESCGVYAYEGHDVTPVMYRMPFFTEGRWDAKVYASIIGSINNANDVGYHHVASFWLSLLKEYGFRNRLPFVVDNLAFGIFTLNKHEVPRTDLRWNASWQVNEERVQGIGPAVVKSNRPHNLDDYSMDQWWRSRVRDVTYLPETGGSRIRPQETRLVPRWARYE